MKIIKSKTIGSDLFLIIFACSAILLPAHPSLQGLLVSVGIPASVVSVFFGIPVIMSLLLNCIIRTCGIKTILLLIPFIIWMCFLSLISPCFECSTNMSALKGIGVLTPLSILCAMVASRDQNNAVLAIFIFGLLAVFHFFVLYIFGFSINEENGFHSLAGDAESPNYQLTTFYFGFVAITSSVCLMRSYDKYFLINLSLLALALLSMLIAGGRSSILAYVIVTLFFANSQTLTRIIYYLLLLIVIVIISITIYTGGVNSDFFTDIPALNRFVALIEEDDSSGRIRLYSSALSMWLESPRSFIMGGGIGTFPTYIGETDEGWYPHNFILESLAEGGIIPVLLLVPCAYFFIKYAFIVRSRSSYPLSTTILCAYSLYSICAYQLMGGLRTLWIPIFFLSLFMFGFANVKKR